MSKSPKVLHGVLVLFLGFALGCMQTPEGGSCFSDLNCSGAMVCEYSECVDWSSDYDYGGSSGGDGGSCSGSYGGPYYDDYQVESQCENIYAYGCSQEAVDAGCAILDQWESNGVPNVCPYC
jgi:hypothetical protein